MHHLRHTVRNAHGNITIVSDMPTIERDTLQCVHCGRHWTVQPGSGKTRGFCNYHSGVTCGSPDCNNCQRKERGMQIVQKPDKRYAAYKRKENQLALHHTMTKGGIIIP